MKGLFVTGTDTGVGKTVISSWIAAKLTSEGHKVGAYKPVCSGSSLDTNSQKLVWNDIDQLHASINQFGEKEWVCPQRFHAPLAPPVAAKLESKKVDEKLLVDGIHHWKEHVDGIIVEGVGGWLCPLTNEITIADVAQNLGFPVLVVASAKLGTINHTLLTLESIQRRQIPVAGVVLNSFNVKDLELIKGNAGQILAIGKPTFLTCFDSPTDTDLHCWTTSAKIDWWDEMQESHF